MAVALSSELICVSDDELVERLRQGDEYAFNLLYERYFPRVFRFVDRRLGNRADTEETVQEVFINVLGSIDGFRGEAPFAAWVFGLTRRTVAGRFKKRRHPTISLEGADGTHMQARTSEPTPIENYEVGELLRDLENNAANKLTEEQRTLFRLHHVEHRSIAEIAEELDKTENAVKSNLYRTRKLLLSR